MNSQTTRIAFVVAIALSPATYATNGYQLIGIGSHQNSLGGAVTANPGSAMTAITNPAGMARIGKRADFSMEMFMPDRFVDFTGQGGERSDSAATAYGVPALGWTAPVEEGKDDLYFGGGMYGTSGLGTDYGVTNFAQGGTANEMDFEGYSMIQFWQMAPTLAWNVNKQLTIGGSLNIDYQSVSLKQKLTADPNGDNVADATMMSLDMSRNAQAFGYGITLGVLYDITHQITLGFSYKSKQNFPDMEYQLAAGDISLDSNLGMGSIPGCNLTTAMANGACPAGLYKLQLDFPPITSVGVAYSPIQSLKLSFDIKQIQWSETLDVLKITGPNGMQFNMPAGWDDQTVYALGVEYSVNDRLRLRAGYNTADAPIDAVNVDSNLILPATVEKNIAMGADWRLSNSWDIGFHYGKASENALTSNASPTKIGLSITTFGINLGYRF